jgi:spore maturation protein CgeB
MRIVVAGRYFPDSFARNIAVTLERMGHLVHRVEQELLDLHSKPIWKHAWGLFEKAFPSLEKRKQVALVRAVEWFEPAVVILTYGDLPPDTILDIRRASGAKLAVWYPDHLANLGRQYLLASELDAWFFKDPYLAETLREKLGLNAHYLPEACNPLWHRRVELTEAERRKYGCDLCTASNMYYYRARTLEPFKDYDLKIWGASYPRWMASPLRANYPGIYVAELEKAKAFNAAKVVLNTMHYAEIEGVNCRLFEAAGCGAFQIADRKPALAELLEPEREVVTFRTRQELKEKVDYYLAHPEERQEIADRAYARAHREHTYEHRLNRVLEVLGFPAPVGVTAQGV